MTDKAETLTEFIDKIAKQEPHPTEIDILLRDMFWTLS